MTFDWKSFLKPTWQKAVIYIILSILFIPLLPYILSGGKECFRGSCTQIRLRFESLYWIYHQFFLQAGVSFSPNQLHL